MLHHGALRLRPSALANGIAERRGGSWALIYAKLAEDRLITEAELSEAVAAVITTPKTLCAKSGCSGPGPAMLEICSMLTMSLQPTMQLLQAPKFSRSQVIRNRARAAFFRCQTKEALQRTVNHRPRGQEQENYGFLVRARCAHWPRGPELTTGWQGEFVAYWLRLVTTRRVKCFGSRWP